MEGGGLPRRGGMWTPAHLSQKCRGLREEGPRPREGPAGRNAQGRDVLGAPGAVEGEEGGSGGGQRQVRGAGSTSLSSLVDEGSANHNLLVEWGLLPVSMNKVLLEAAMPTC